MSDIEPNASWREKLLTHHRWLVFLLPLAVYMLAGSFEPTPQKPGGAAVGLAIDYAWYPAVYSVKIVLTIAALVLVWPGYGRFPRRIGVLGIGIGIVGVSLWIGLCSLGIERDYLARWLPWLVDAGERSGFNPFDKIASQPAAWGFLAIRFLGLTAIVPLVEEMFYRGFLMPFTVQNDWWEVPQGDTNRMGIALSIAVPLMMHPGELLAAAVWFSMVTWLFLRTRNVWECVAAHATTNLLLGIYVVATGHWELM